MKENKTLRWFLGMLSVILFVAGLVATISMTIGAIEILSPGNTLMAALAPAFFDVGFILWMGLYFWKNDSTQQGGISLLMAFVDGLGMAVMIFTGRFLFGGQSLVTPPPSMPYYVIGITTGVIILNVVAAIITLDTRPMLSRHAQKHRNDLQSLKRGSTKTVRYSRVLCSSLITRLTVSAQRWRKCTPQECLCV